MLDKIKVFTFSSERVFPTPCVGVGINLSLLYRGKDSWESFGLQNRSTRIRFPPLISNARVAQLDRAVAF